MINLASVLNSVNFKIPGGRWQLFEFGDLSIIPTFIKHDQHDALAARWTRRIPIFQPHAPAELVADSILELLQQLQQEDEARGGSGAEAESERDVPQNHWTVIDFHSHSGGPIPTVEMLVNHGRVSPSPSSPSSPSPLNSEIQIPFLLTSPNPPLDLDSWLTHASRSPTHNLRFLPQPVDPSRPPFAAISASTRGDRQAARSKGFEFEDERKRVVRTYCGAFHRFRDEEAVGVLKSTMETSDAFVITELQERRLWGLMLTPVLEVGWMMLLGGIWFWGDWVHLLCTYVFPVLPLTQFFDGVIACLRTRGFEEVMRLVARARRKEGKGEGEGEEEILWNAREGCCGDWYFTHSRKRYAWPVGYVTVITGKKVK